MKGTLAVVILTFNEEIHIKRCIESVAAIANQVLVIDSFSGDLTLPIARSLGARIFQNPFVSQALQFQWAMDNCVQDVEWVMRLDADEYIDEELSRNIAAFIARDGWGHNGGVFLRRHIFLGKWIRHGGRYPLHMLRLFRRGTAHIEQRWMDEHIVLDQGDAIVLRGGFSDDNRNPVSWFIEKHNSYATREMIDIMLMRLRPAANSGISSGTGLAIRGKRFMKEHVYLNLPYFMRPFLYFCFRYFLQLGLLDGVRGLAYHFMQGFWYRMLVDLKCMEMEMIWAGCLSDEEKLSELENHTGYKLRR